MLSVVMLWVVVLWVVAIVVGSVVVVVVVGSGLRSTTKIVLISVGILHFKEF